jgi:predicted PurR-regulated permease PerM
VTGLILAAFIAIILAVLYRRFGKKLHLPGGGKNLWFLVIVIVVLLMLFYGAQNTPHTPIK